MNKFIKSIALAALAGAIASAPVYADVEQIGNDSLVKVSGTATAGDMVTIQVYKGKLDDKINGNTLLELKKEDYLKYIVCHQQTKANENGMYDFYFNVNLGTGYYSVYTATADGMLEPEEFMFISNTDFKKAVQLLIDADSALYVEGDEDDKSVETVLENNYSSFGITDDEYKSYNIKSLATVLYNTIQKTPLSVDDRDGSMLTISRAILVEKLNEGKITNIYDEDIKVTQLDKSSVAKWYNDDYVTSNLEKIFTNNLSKKSFTSYDSYTKAIAEAFVLATVEHPNGNSNVENLVAAFQKEIGVDASKGSDIWDDLAGQKLASFSKLKEEFNRLTNPDTTTSLGGGGGGGGGGAGPTPVVTDPGIEGVGFAKEEDDELAAEQIPLDIFADLDSVEWARDAIRTLAEKGIINGYSDGTFGPNNSITRAEFCKIVVALLGDNVPETEMPFIDVPEDDWSYPYIKKAYAAGVTKGISDTQFGKDLLITRQDMAVMIYNAAVYGGRSFEQDDEVFADDTLIANYAKQAVYSLKNAGVINGVDDENFAPVANATRAEAAKMIFTLINE